MARVTMPGTSNGRATMTTSTSLSCSMSARLAVMFSSMASGMLGATTLSEWMSCGNR
jgi:hypothetical protein